MQRTQEPYTSQSEKYYSDCEDGKCPCRSFSLVVDSLVSSIHVRQADDDPDCFCAYHIGRMSDGKKN